MGTQGKRGRQSQYNEIPNASTFAAVGSTPAAAFSSWRPPFPPPGGECRRQACGFPTDRPSPPGPVSQKLGEGEPTEAPSRPSPPGPLSQKLGEGEPTTGSIRSPLAPLLGEGPGVRAKTKWP